MKNDTDLRRDVLDELEWEPSIDAAEIGVTAHDGVVTLTGTVKSYTAEIDGRAGRQAAPGRQGDRQRHRSPIARHRRAHRLRHRPGGRRRSEVEDRRCRMTESRSSVSNGWITLEGEVDWQYQKDAAFEAVHHLVGVKGVTNLIALKPRVSATDVKSRIEAAFRRSAELDAQKVRVETHDGKVTLRGDVHSWSERQEAERTAWAAPGSLRSRTSLRLFHEKEH